MSSDSYSCPVCNAPMTLRANRRTGEQFWGCSRYPSCNGGRNMDGDDTTRYDAQQQVRRPSSPVQSPFVKPRPGSEDLGLIQEIHDLAVQAHDGTVGQCAGILKKIIELTRSSNFPDAPVNALAEVRTGFQPIRPGMFRNLGEPVVPDDEELPF